MQHMIVGLRCKVTDCETQGTLVQARELRAICCGTDPARVANFLGGDDSCRFTSIQLLLLYPIEKLQCSSPTELHQ